MQSKTEDELINHVDTFVSAYDETVQQAGLFEYSQRNLLRDIYFYTNSKFLNGDTDEYGREKRFSNIVNYRVNIAIRATDLDVKDFQVTSDNDDATIKSMILGKELYQWAKRNRFGAVLNRFGEVECTYGGVIIKLIDTPEGIKPEICKWHNLITNQEKIEGNTIIEEHKLSFLELNKKRGVWDETAITDLIADAVKKERNYVKVLEVQGEFAKSIVDESAGEFEYSLQHHFVGEFENSDKVRLFKEPLKKPIYLYHSHQEVDGRGLGRGIVEDGIEAQIGVNDSVMAQQQISYLSRKIVLLSGGTDLDIGNIADIDNGQVMPNGIELTRLNLTTDGLPLLQQTIDFWHTQYERASSTFDAISGETMPSSTAFRSVMVQNQNAASTFDYRRERRGEFLGHIVQEYILPSLIKRINKKHILAGTYSVKELKLIDESFSNYRALNKAKEKILNNELFRPEDLDTITSETFKLLKKDGDKRFLEVPEDYFKNFKAEISIITTGEQINKATILQSLSQIIETVAANPMILQDDGLRTAFYRMVELSGAGISPSELIPTAQPPQQAQPSQVQLGQPQGSEEDQLVAGLQQ